MNIIFMGTPEFGAIILEELAKSDYKPVLVVTEPDKPVGRKQTLTPPPVKIMADKNKIEILQPKKIKEIKEKIENINPDLIVIAAYGQMIPEEILNIPKYGPLNVHPSLLPKYRGPSPIQYAILNGDKETGVSVMKINEKMDEGEIVSSISYPVSDIETYETLYNKLAKIGAELLIKTIPQWIKGEIKPQPQDETKATYTKILTRENGKIDWQKPAEEIERQIRAYSPWPGSFTVFCGKMLKILEADILICEEKKQAGEVFLTKEGELAVGTGQSCLIVRKLQLEGGKPLLSQDFLRGHQEIIGTILK